MAPAAVLGVPDMRPTFLEHVPAAEAESGRRSEAARAGACCATAEIRRSLVVTNADNNGRDEPCPLAFDDDFDDLDNVINDEDDDRFYDKDDDKDDDQDSDEDDADEPDDEEEESETWQVHPPRPIPLNARAGLTSRA
jgi:hypothetical protein